MSSDRELTDDELAQVVRYVAQLALEVERGLRPPDQLATVMDPTGLKRWQQVSPRPAFPSRPVLPADIGPPRVRRPATGRAIANVTVRTEPGRWAAVSMSIDVRPGRCRVMDLHRLPATGERRAHRPFERASHVPLEAQARQVREVRDMAQAAGDAVRQRLGELAAGQDPDRRRAFTRLAARWDELVEDHDRQLDAIYERLQTRLVIQRSRHR